MDWLQLQYLLNDDSAVYGIESKATLEKIARGAAVKGILPDCLVTIREVR